MKRDVIIALFAGILIGSISALTIINLPSFLKSGSKSPEPNITQMPPSITQNINIQTDLEISQPPDGSISETKNIDLMGKTSSGSMVLIDTDKDSATLLSGKDGRFRSPITLGEGVNTVYVTVYSTKGDSRTKTINVYYTPEKL